MAEIADNFGIGELPVAADGTIPVLPCRVCAEPTLSIRETELDGRVVLWAYVCRPCQADLDADIAELRKTYEALIADGRSVDLANEIMRRWYCWGEA